MSSGFRSPTATSNRSPILDFKPVPISYISYKELKDSLMLQRPNRFLEYLQRLFGEKIVTRLAGAKPDAETEAYRPYFIGTSKHWDGATIFWQLDTAGKVRTGKIMLYDPATGKRVKHPFNHINWVHKVPDRPDFNLKQCMFGEHLLVDKSKPVALVESEKTAIIASVYLPEFTWLACGSLTNLNADKCSVLRGRQVVLFPDLNGYDKWAAKAKDLSHIANFKVSDLLERKASDQERREGLDLADYLTRFDFKQFKLSRYEAVVVSVSHFEEPEPICELAPAMDTYRHQPFLRRETDDSWADEIGQLEQFYSKITFPSAPVRLCRCSTVVNGPLFVESHLAIVKANQGKRTFLPYLERLRKFREVLDQ